MKLALDYKKLHLRFFLGTGFVLFVIGKAVKRKNPAAAAAVKPLGKDIKKLLKNYKRENGSLKLVEIEDRNKARIVVKL